MGAPTRARWKKRQDKPAQIALGVLGGLLLSALLAFTVWALASGKGWLSPVDVIKALVERTLSFNAGYFLALAGVAVVLAGLVLGLRAVLGSGAVKPSWVDVAATHMATGKDLKDLSRKNTIKKAQRLGVKGSNR